MNFEFTHISVKTWSSFVGSSASSWQGGLRPSMLHLINPECTALSFPLDQSPLFNIGTNKLQGQSAVKDSPSVFLYKCLLPRSSFALAQEASGWTCFDWKLRTWQFKAALCGWNHPVRGSVRDDKGNFETDPPEPFCVFVSWMLHSAPWCRGKCLTVKARLVAYLPLDTLSPALPWKWKHTQTLRLWDTRFSWGSAWQESSVGSGTAGGGCVRGPGSVIHSREELLSLQPAPT